MLFLSLYLSCLAVRICSHGLFACHFACHKLYAVFLWLYYIVVFYTFCVFLFKNFYVCQLCITVYGLVALLLLTCFWIVSSSWLAIQVTVVTLSYVFFILFFYPFTFAPPIVRLGVAPLPFFVFFIYLPLHYAGSPAGATLFYLLYLILFAFPVPIFLLYRLFSLIALNLFLDVLSLLGLGFDCPFFLGLTTAY